MPFEQRATSRAVSLIDTLESPDQTKGRILAAVGGALVTIVMWVVHLMYPEIFSTLIQDDGWGKLFLGFVLAPPFVLAFAVGSFIYREGIEQVKHESGPMSGYFYRESANKRWKLFIVAGIITALNFLLMLMMPRACPVESHACCYTEKKTKVSRCHGLVPWSLTLAAN